MKIVAIDSSGLVASVAIIEDDNLIAEYNVSFKKTHSQTLLPIFRLKRKRQKEILRLTMNLQWRPHQTL